MNHAQRFSWLPLLKALPRVIYRDFMQDGLSLRAMGLVYISLLSLVPLLALCFAVLTAFGIHNQLKPSLLQLLAPLGEQGATEITGYILTFVENVDVGTLGFTGLAMLLYTVVSLMQQIEAAFNHTWRVRRARNLWQQFRDYLSLVMIGPVMAFTALGLTTTFSHAPLLQSLIEQMQWGSTALVLVLDYLPLLMIVLAFVFIYRFLPNTHVSYKAALIGATVAGIGWVLAGWAFASFIVEFGRQKAIYTVFASFFFFILWLYVVWLILLSGSTIAYYVQNPRALILVDDDQPIAPKARLALTVLLMQSIIQRFQTNQAPATLHQLTQDLSVPDVLLEPILEQLIDSKLLSYDDAQPPHYLLLVAPENINIGKLREEVWEGGQSQRELTDELLAGQHSLDDVMLTLANADASTSLSNLSQHQSEASTDSKA